MELSNLKEPANNGKIRIGINAVRKENEYWGINNILRYLDFFSILLNRKFYAEDNKNGKEIIKCSQAIKKGKKDLLSNEYSMRFLVEHSENEVCNKFYDFLTGNFSRSEALNIIYQMNAYIESRF